MSILQPDDHPDMYGPNITLDEAVAERDTALDQLALVTTDRDIKAANLRLLVEKVLVWAVQDSVFQVAPEVQPQWDELMSFARSLKQ